MVEKKPDWLETTIQTYQQTFNFIKLNQKNYENPLSKMLFEVTAFADCFKNTKEHLEKLDKIYTDPVIYILEVKPELFSPKKRARMQVKKSLPKLEWIFFRDSHKYTQLKKKYYVDQDRIKHSKYITFEDISGLKGHIEREIGKIFNDIVKLNNVAIEMVTIPKVEAVDLTGLGVDKSEY